MDFNRRDFMKSIALSLSAVALAPVIRIREVFAAEVDPNKPPANFLNYISNADTASKSTDPEVKKRASKRKDKKAYCNNCQYYQTADRKAPMAPCPLVGGADVHNKGWCQSWVAMAKKK